MFIDENFCFKFWLGLVILGRLVTTGNLVCFRHKFLAMKLWDFIVGRRRLLSQILVWDFGVGMVSQILVLELSSQIFLGVTNCSWCHKF